MKKRNVQLIAFDLDGTLMDAYLPVCRSLNYALQKVGLPPVDNETIKRTVGWGDKHLLRTLAGEDEIEEVVAIYREHHAESLKDGTELLPGAADLLRCLKDQGHRMSIASNRPTKFSYIAMDYLGITDYFDFVLCGDVLSRAKPHPEILHKTLANFSLEPRQALYVGDMVIDIETAKGAGVKVAAVLTGSSTKEEIAALDPEYIMENVFEVKDILEELNRHSNG